MTSEEALVIANDALTDIVNILEPKMGQYETQIVAVVKAVARAEAALRLTCDATDEVSRGSQTYQGGC